MKYCHYTTSRVEVSEDEKATSTTVPVEEGVCHKSRLEYLAEPGVTVSFEMISDEDMSALVGKWGGVEVKPNDARLKQLAKDAAKDNAAAAKKNAQKEGEALV